MHNSTTYRTFIAIPIPENIKVQLQELINRFRGFIPDRAVKWVNVENMHLTIKFLGDSNEKVNQEIGDKLSEFVESVSPFSLHLSGTGAFPNLSSPKVFWVGCSKPLELIQISQNIEEICQQFGFEKEVRPFSPHLTIGRTAKHSSPSQLRDLTQEFGRYNKKDFGQFPVSKIVIYKSDLTPQGPIYSPMRNIVL